MDFYKILKWVSNKKKMIFYIFLTALVFLSATTSFAQTASGVPSLQLSPYTMSLTNKAPLDNVNFSACLMQQVGVGSVGSDIDAISGGYLGAGSIDIGTGGFGACSSPMPPKPDLTNCYFTPKGDIDNSHYAEMTNDVKQGEAILDCQKNRANEAKAAANCFAKQIKALKEDMLDIKKDLDDNMKNMTQYISSVKSLQDQEVQKQAALDGRRQQLEASMTEVQTEVDALNKGTSKDAASADSNSLSGLRIKYKDYVAQQKAFTIAQRNELAHRTAVCIFGEGSTSSSVRECPIYNQDGSASMLDPKTCILTLYRNNIASQMSNGGTITNDIMVKANRAQSVFAGSLSIMIRDLTASEARFSTIEDFVNDPQNQSKFQSWGNAGIQMHDELLRCGDQSHNDIVKELNDPESLSGLGAKNKDVNDQAEALNSALGEKLNNMDKVYKNAYTAITAQDAGSFPGPSSCHNAPYSTPTGQTKYQTVDLQAQLNCIEGWKGTLETMLNGGTKPIPLTIPGYGTVSYCSDLHSCLKGDHGVESLIATSKRQQTGMEGDGFFNEACMSNPAMPDPSRPCSCSPQGQCPGIKNYTRRSNTDIEANVKALAGQLKQRMGEAQKQLIYAQDLFSRAGIDFPAESSGTSRDFKCTQDPNVDTPTLCQLPDPFEDKMLAAAGFTNLDPTAFATADKEATAKIQELTDTKIPALHTDLAAIDNKKNTCEKEAKEKKMTALENRLQKSLDECRQAGGIYDPSNKNDPDSKKLFDSFTSGFAQLANDIKSACVASDGSGQCGMLMAGVGDEPADKCLVLAEGTVKREEAQEAREERRMARSIALGDKYKDQSKGGASAGSNPPAKTGKP